MLTASMAEENISSLEKFKTYFEEGCDLQACDDFGLKVILKVALGDGKNPYAKEPYLAVLDFLLEMDAIPRIDKIDALELAGAILLSHDGNHAKFTLAFQYWRRALSLRLMQMDTEEGPIYKTFLQCKNGQLSEWCSLEDLQRIEKNPAEREMQSLLVRLRIFAGLSWKAVRQYLFFPSITSITQFLRKGMQGEIGRRPISQVLDMAYIFVDTLLRSERPHQRDLGGALLGIVELLIHTFNSFQNRPLNLTSEDLDKFVDTLLMTDPSYGCLPLSKYNNLDAPAFETRQLIYLLEMIKILLKCSDLTTETIRQSLRTWGRGPSGQELLLFACDNLGFQSRDIIHFLVHLGASPYARDIRGNGPFHCLAFTGPEYGHDSEAIARFLLDCAHGHGLGMMNEEGMTAADVWFQNNTPGTRNVGDLPNWLQASEAKPNALKCLSAAAIRRYKVPYDDGTILPAVLIPFVSKH